MIRVGRRLNIRWLVYNPIEFYRWHIFATATRKAVGDAMLKVFPDARSFADIGSGTGTYAAELRRRDRRVYACEHSTFGRMFGLAQCVPTNRFNLAKRTPSLVPTADVAYCFEVAEHVPPELGDRLVDFLAFRYSTVLFTAAHPGQGGFEHINEQPREYWVERFARHDMALDADASDRIAGLFRDYGAPWWLADNAMVFRA